MGFDEKSLAEQEGAPPAAGDAGSNFLNSFLPPDMTDAEQVAVFNRGAHELKDLAGKSGFAINEAGLQEYIKLCDMFIDEYPEKLRNLRLLTERAKMGSSPYAVEVANFNVTVASGDPRSLIPNLESMFDGYVQLKEAFILARKNYREADSEHDQVFKKIKTE